MLDRFSCLLVVSGPEPMTGILPILAHDFLLGNLFVPSNIVYLYPEVNYEVSRIQILINNNSKTFFLKDVPSFRKKIVAAL